MEAGIARSSRRSCWRIDTEWFPDRRIRDTKGDGIGEKSQHRSKIYTSIQNLNICLSLLTQTRRVYTHINAVHIHRDQQEKCKRNNDRDRVNAK